MPQIRALRPLPFFYSPLLKKPNIVGNESNNIHRHDVTHHICEASIMPREAKYAGPCKVCGVAIAVGDMVSNYGTHWCKNEACARSKQVQPTQAPPAQAPQAPQPTPAPQTMAQPTAVPDKASTPKRQPLSLIEALERLKEFEVVHDKALAIATKKAQEALPADADGRSRHILLQVIYKEAMAFVRHC